VSVSLPAQNGVEGPSRTLTYPRRREEDRRPCPKNPTADRTHAGSAVVLPTRLFETHFGSAHPRRP